MSDAPSYRVKVGAPGSFGWVKHPDQSGKVIEAWERPDGLLVRLPRNFRFVVVQRPGEAPYVKPLMQSAPRLW